MSVFARVEPIKAGIENLIILTELSCYLQSGIHCFFTESDVGHSSYTSSVKQFNT